ncbi:unnamed protein product [Phaedon cochleariae]|uniref:C2 domain-containing protein n=1 Tax=Phaedon cochleariae TaxID=80249 RepID=A0A9N9SEN3_PHACE|nr:unnamed protein product [Phaedon cochleariae]
MHQGTCYNISEAQAIMVELRNIQKSLSSGEKEKADLMQSLAKLKDELTRLQLSESSLDISTLSLPQEKLSTASQTDLSCELVPIGTRLAEMAKMRLEYDEARKRVQHIQQKLADLEEKVHPGQVESDKDRLLLFQEKEQLLRELRSIAPRMRTKEEMTGIRSECKRLEEDLNKALEMSNRAIADRLRLHEEKQLLLQQLKDGLRQMTQLESRLKTLSASTLSVSSSSSLGSLSTTSSKGSLSSGLSFTDIYGGPQCIGSTNSEKPIDMADLHKRVERLLKPAESPARPASPPGRSQPSLSPRSSLSSVSPPVSPVYENLPPNGAGQPPPAYEQVRRERAMRSEQRQIEERLVELRLSTPSFANTDCSFSPRPALFLPADHLEAQPHDPVGGCRPLRYSYESAGDHLEAHAQELAGGCRPARYSYESAGDAPLSPISESAAPVIEGEEGAGAVRGAALSRTSSSGTNTRSVSAAVSDESVAGDSGVFEASNRKRASNLFPLDLDAETAQVQIKLRYLMTENMLNITIEKARNLSALMIPDDSEVYVKTALLPANPTQPSVFSTKCVKDLKKATFADVFNVQVPVNKIFTKTLQLNIWNKPSSLQEICVGCAQVSLADFNVHHVTQKWYNVLSLRPDHPAHPPSSLRPLESDASARLQAGKEESSDDSTIVSSQTSTLTRNQETLTAPRVDIDFEELYDCFRSSAAEGYDDSEDSEEDLGEECDEEGITVEFRSPDKLDVVLEQTDDCDDACAECDDACAACSDQLQLQPEYSDKQTNTECAFHPEQAKQMKLRAAAVGGGVGGGASEGPIRRSQTFSPSAQVSKAHYACKLNRSDSDSAMPLYRRGSKPFERHAVERRSLRFRRQPHSATSTTSLASPHHHHHPAKPHAPTVARTSIDLELDLRAQHARLDKLQAELLRLRDLKRRLESAKERGDVDVAAGLLENGQFQTMMAQAESRRVVSGPEERRLEKMLRRVSKEIYKLRKSKAGNGKPDLISFKEKMAFFTRTDTNVPFLPIDECHSGNVATKNSNEDKPPQGADEDSGKVVNEEEKSKNGDQESAARYGYYVDRALGVEV